MARYTVDLLAFLVGRQVVEEALPMQEAEVGRPFVQVGQGGRVTDQEGVRMVGHISPPAASLLHLLTRDIR